METGILRRGNVGISDCECLFCNYKKSLTKKQKSNIIYIRLRTSIDQLITTRGCTGFDGDFEVGEAIRGPGPRSKPELKIKRKR